MDTCTICDTNSTLLICKICKVKCCEPCLNSHQTSCGVMKEHHYHLCKLNRDHQLDVYCQQCSELICTNCRSVDHNNHVILPIKTAFDNFKKAMPMVGQDYTKYDQLKNSIEVPPNQQLTELLNEVKTYFDFLGNESFPLAFLSKWSCIQHALTKYKQLHSTAMESPKSHDQISSHVPDASRVQDRVVLAENLGLTRSNPDYYALQVGNHVLGGAFYATRLFRDLRENSGLVYYVSSSFNIGKHRSSYIVNYGCNPPNVAKAKDIVVKDLKQMQKAEVSPKELRMAKSVLLRKITLSESSIDDIAGGLLQRSLKGLPLNQPVIAAKHYVSITSGEVKSAFAKWLYPNNLVQVTLGPNPK